MLLFPWGKVCDPGWVLGAKVKFNIHPESLDRMGSLVHRRHCLEFL